MSEFTRYAIYYLPPPGPLAEFAAAWLGWDVARATEIARPEVAGIAEATEAPRKYGFHGTLKAPFRLADGTTEADLRASCARFAGRCAPARLDGLGLGTLGRFLALVPEGPSPDLDALAARCVTEFDGFRAPASAAEIARRRGSALTERQDAQMLRWGYPHVFADFRFHMTLTGRLGASDLGRFRDEIAARLPDLPRPHAIDQIALVAERTDGRFVLRHRYALSG